MAVQFLSAFRFKEPSEEVNWKLLRSVDLDLLAKQPPDLASLKHIVAHLACAGVAPSVAAKTPIADLSLLGRVCQLALQFTLHGQKFLETTLQSRPPVTAHVQQASHSTGVIALLEQNVADLKALSKSYERRYTTAEAELAATQKALQEAKETIARMEKVAALDAAKKSVPPTLEEQYGSKSGAEVKAASSKPHHHHHHRCKHHRSGGGGGDGGGSTQRDFANIMMHQVLLQQQQQFNALMGGRPPGGSDTPTPAARQHADPATKAGGTLLPPEKQYDLDTQERRHNAEMATVRAEVEALLAAQREALEGQRAKQEQVDGLRAAMASTAHDMQQMRAAMDEMRRMVQDSGNATAQNMEALFARMAEDVDVKLATVKRQSSSSLPPIPIVSAATNKHDAVAREAARSPKPAATTQVKPSLVAKGLVNPVKSVATVDCEFCKKTVEAAVYAQHAAACRLRDELMPEVRSSSTATDRTSAGPDDQCPHCGETVQPHDLVDHAETCDYRPVVCAACHETYSFKNASIHQSTCKMRPRPCAQCGALVPANEQCVRPCEHCRSRHKCADLVAHEQTCDMRMLPCPECFTKITLKLFDDHLRGCKGQKNTPAGSAAATPRGTPTSGLPRKESELDRARREFNEFMAEEEAAELAKKKEKEAAASLD